MGSVLICELTAKVENYQVGVKIFGDHAVVGTSMYDCVHVSKEHVESFLQAVVPLLEEGHNFKMASTLVVPPVNQGWFINEGGC